MRVFRKVPILIIALFAILGGTALATASPANAGSGNQLCYETGGQACLNAWSGGPWVKVYTKRGVVNNDFTVIWNPNGQAYQIEFTGGGSWNGHCVGDAYNDPNNGYASLDQCGVSGVPAGWGTLFDLVNCGSNAYCFKNEHWTAVQGRADFLGPNPAGYSDGSPFVLNAHTQNYFYIYPPA